MKYEYRLNDLPSGNDAWHRLVSNGSRFIKTGVMALALAVAVGCGGNNGGQNEPNGQDTKDASAAVAVDPEGKPNPGDPSGDYVNRGDTIIDETQAIKSGPAKYWYTQSGLGVNGKMIWTYVNGNAVSNSMTWRSGLGAGKYKVEAFIPRNYATTRSAGYRIQAIKGGSTSTLARKSVNQYSVSDVWVDLGTYEFNGEPAVFLGDDTGEAYSTKRMIGFDAIKFVPQSNGGGGGGGGINVPCFYQKDGAWGGKAMRPSTLTMAGYGCLVTSISSVMNWAGFSTDPGKYCDWLSNSSNGGFDKAGLYQEPPKVLASKYTGGKLRQVDWVKWYTVAADLNRIKGELDAGRPVVIEVRYKANDSTNYMHWVAAVGYSVSSGKVSDLTIMDPLNANKQLTTMSKTYNHTNNLGRWIYGARFFAKG